MKSSKNKKFQREIFCPYCDKFQAQLHYCQIRRRHINFVRYNKVMIVSKTEAGAQRICDYDGEDDDWDSMISYRNVMDMDINCREEADMWKKADWKEQIADWKEQIEEEQKEDIQEFNTTITTFSIDQKGADGF